VHPAARAVVSWQPQVQLGPTQGLQPQVLDFSTLASFMTFLLSG
jgi:hypothetical protein